MSAEPYVVDTSANLTLIEDEPGADRVQEILTDEDVLLPWVVLLETVCISRQERGEAEAERRYARLKQLGTAVPWEADDPILLTAARFKAEHRVSLADAIIAAFAARNGAVRFHKDPEYKPLAPLVRRERLPYKTWGVPPLLPFSRSRGIVPPVSPGRNACPSRLTLPREFRISLTDLVAFMIV